MELLHIAIMLAAISLFCGVELARAETGGNNMNAIHVSGIDVTAQTLKEMTDEFGAPSTESFVLGPGVDEFRIELLNFFDEAELKENPPVFLEATWPIPGALNLTIWYRQVSDALIYQHHLVWDQGADF